MGADLVATAPHWHRWDEVVMRAPPIVVARGQGPANISASEIRARLWRDDAIAALVPLAVLGYITAHALYR